MSYSPDFPDQRKAAMSIRKRLFALSCLGFALAPATHGSASEAPGLHDVQIGEQGDRTRIALVCEADCSLSKHSNSDFLLRGANADLNLELGEHSNNVAGLTAISAGGGSLVKVIVGREIDYVDAKSCAAGGRKAACIDLYFKPLKAAAARTTAASAPVRTATAPATASPPRPALRAETKAGADKTAEAKTAQTNRPILREPPKTRVSASAARIASAASTVKAPGLRDGGGARIFRFAEMTSPERFAPPQGVTLAKLQPANAPSAFHAASVRLKPASATLPGLSVDQQILTILGKDLNPEYCARARAILNSDPWALKAMGDIGLCALVEGEAEEAEAILSRLLEYTPDHYEAHVGRALIAAEAGERSVARKYFQDALNALPPIEESDRIVAAMNSL